MGTTTIKRKLKKRRMRAKLRKQLLSRSKIGSYSRPTEEELKALGVASLEAAIEEAPKAEVNKDEEE